MSSDAVFFMQRLVQHVPNFQFVGLSSQQGSHWWPGEDWLQDCAAPRLLALANFVTIGFSAYYKLIYIYILIPVLVVPHKAVAEVSKIDNYGRGELL